MIRRILTNGLASGLAVGVPLFGITVGLGGHTDAPWGVVVGYLIMLVALSVVFVAIKRRRDMELGGLIRFWPAFAYGLAISVVAGVIYVVAWEAALAVTHLDFAATYADGLIARQKAQGLSGAALEQFIARMDEFKRQYANPLYRLPMTFAEIFPVGVLVSLVSAGLLRNSRFLPMRRAPSRVAEL
ncbi:MAG: DUF4199 domain-containing protein [Steroidobacteraceae bacterium]|mgnify:CR=1 FL=1